MKHLDDYAGLLSRIVEIGDNAELRQLSTCVQKAQEAQQLFAGAFEIFRSGSFEPIKEFMNSEEYLAIRDAFMNGTMEYWNCLLYTSQQAACRWRKGNPLLPSWKG